MNLLDKLKTNIVLANYDRSVATENLVSLHELSELLGKDSSSVNKKAKFLGIHGQLYTVDPPAQREKFFTEIEANKIIISYPGR